MSTVNPEHIRLLVTDHERARDHLRGQLRTQTPLMISELIQRGWTMRRVARACGLLPLYLQGIHRGEQRAGAAVAFAVAGVLIQAREAAECT
jgi:hypothetical protein